MKGIFLILILCCNQLQAQVEVAALRCEQRFGPQGIDVRAPRLSWQIRGKEKNIMQKAWQVLVASSWENLDKGDLWNSGKVESAQSVLAPYHGKPLKSGTVCYWKVKVWTTAGESNWSAGSTWSMGLLDSMDWKARWIGYDQGFGWDSISRFSRLSARYFRREFHLHSVVRRAVIYVIGLGHYELYLNGAAVGDQVLAQAPTDYTKSVLYNTYDVTTQCREGGNVVGVVLGNGRYFTMRPRYKPQKIKEFGFPKLLFQLEIEYTDGHKERVVSDEHWKFTADGPIRTNNEYDGEEYDATKELKGWNEVGYRDDGWLKPQLVGAPGGRIGAQMDAPIKVMAHARPVDRKRVGGKWILDMGQNMAGWVKMKVRGSRGQRVVLRYGETLQKDGELYTANLRDALVTDIYTLKGEGEEIWQPAFVFHGFRYVEISGYPGEPGLEDFEGEVVYDDMKTTGYFTTDNELVNRIYVNAWWSIAANYKGMPLDCPQRNERMPWLGDRATGSLGESYVFGNASFYAKWLGDIADAQKPDGSLPDVAPAYWNYYSDNMTWPGTYLLVADMLYRQYGDLQSIGRHYASMKKWLYYMKGKYSAGGIMMKDKYGDWCVPPESPELIHSRDSSRMTDGKLIATAYYYHLLGLMEGFARQTGHEDKEWRRLAIEVKDAFNKKWLDGKTGGYSNNTVTANLLPLYFGMTPEPYRDRVFGHIVRKIEENKEHISTGVIGTQWLMRGLTQYGRPDLAWKIATNKDYPGWGYMVGRGATTIWELWNGDSADPAMNSHNHVMLLGDLITWMYEDLAGIAPGEPGFKKIVMHPSFVGPGSVTATYDTPYGQVSSRWKRSGIAVVWNVTVPGNASAKIYLPDGRVEEVGSGDYQFEANVK